MGGKKMVLKGLVLLGCFFLLLPLITSTTLAATYYVSSSTGNDEWTGTLPEPYPSGNPTDGPWETTNEVNDQSFQAGDTIKFKKGDSWKIGFFANEELRILSSGTSDNNRIT